MKKLLIEIMVQYTLMNGIKPYLRDHYFNIDLLNVK